MNTSSFKLTAQGVEELVVGTPVELNLADLRARYPERTAGHFWVLGVVYAVGDPEAALDEMTLDVDNLVGFDPMRCLWCGREYAPALRATGCTPTQEQER